MNGNIKKVAGLGNGEYLKILCADDWLAPDCLSIMVALMEQNPHVALATSAEVLSAEDGAPIREQFFFGAPISLISGEKMLDRMSRGHGFGGNSSFFIRADSYRLIGGYNAEWRYAADYDLAARLCRVGDYLHIDRPLFHGRVHGQSSSSNDPKELFDVIDWFEIPSRVFQPRKFADREWRRNQRLSGKLTARYLINMAVLGLRGNLGKALQLAAILRKHGNFLLGLPFLAEQLPARSYGYFKRPSAARSQRRNVSQAGGVLSSSAPRDEMI
jgi:hypothetical protein